MITIDPQQELFIAFKLGIEAKGYAVYDGALPPDGTPYPFVYLGEFRQTDTETKGQPFGSVFPSVSVWHSNHKQRGTVSQMLADIKEVARSIRHTNNYAWKARGLTTRIFEDNTTKTPLMHGVFEAEMLFS